MNAVTQIHLTDNDIGNLILIACGDDESLHQLDFHSIDTLYDRGLVSFNCKASPQIALTNSGQAALPQLIRNQS